jgi:hypothetical protein
MGAGMSTPIVSNTVTLTEAGAPGTITITATPTELPSSGGAVTVAGTTNLPDGTAFELYANGQDTGLSATSSGGAFTITYTAPANTSTSPASIALVVTSGGPPPS